MESKNIIREGCPQTPDREAGRVNWESFTAEELMISEILNGPMERERVCRILLTRVCPCLKATPTDLADSKGQGSPGDGQRYVWSLEFAVVLPGFSARSFCSVGCGLDGWHGNGGLQSWEERWLFPVTVCCWCRSCVRDPALVLDELPVGVCKAQKPLQLCACWELVTPPQLGPSLDLPEDSFDALHTRGMMTRDWHGNHTFHPARRPPKQTSSVQGTWLIKPAPAQ